MVSDTVIYATAANNIQSCHICQCYMHACFIAIHVCSGNIRFADLQKFNLHTCSEKPVVGIMMQLFARSHGYQFRLVFVPNPSVSLYSQLNRGPRFYTRLP